MHEIMKLTCVHVGAQWNHRGPRPDRMASFMNSCDFGYASEHVHCAFDELFLIAQREST